MDVCPPTLTVISLSWQLAPLSLFSACNAPCPISSQGASSSSLKTGESSGLITSTMMEKALIGRQDVLQPQSRLSQLIINFVSTGRSESLWPGQEVSNWALSARPGRWETLLLSLTPCQWISADEDIDCVSERNGDVEPSMKRERPSSGVPSTQQHYYWLCIFKTVLETFSSMHLTSSFQFYCTGFSILA